MSESYDLDQQEEDVTLLLHAWPDIEEALLKEAEEDDARSYSTGASRTLADAVREAFRVEVQLTQHHFGLLQLGYVLLYDVNSYAARQAAAALREYEHSLHLRTLAQRRAAIQGVWNDPEVKIVPAAKPVEGEISPRVMATAPSAPDLRDLPEPEPPATSVPLVTRGLHKLTPIEAPFYDALQDTGLVFGVQPRVQGDRTYRPDFIVFYGGKAVVVELDGHEGHKTKQQRNEDAQRELWFQQKGISVLRWTGTQVTADAKACVDQLLLVLRGSQARP
jgi:very-short-patch-repair endonuclease